MKLSIILVHYKSLKMTSLTIKSLLKNKPSFNFEIILVDNASGDGSVEVLKEEYMRCPIHMVFIMNDENLGFSKANNIGVMHASGDYILYLNTDVEVKADTLDKCVDYMEKHPEVGAITPKVLLENGRLDHACKRGFPTPEASFYYLTKRHKQYPQSPKYAAYVMGQLNENETGEIDALTGAFMMVPRKVANETGGFDEDFFMYGEDIDLCYRIKALGYKIIYYSEVEVIHYKGGSSSKSKKLIYEFHRAMWLFYKKNYIRKYSFIVTAAVFVGIQLIYTLKMLKLYIDKLKGRIGLDKK